MATTFPTTLDDFTNPQASDKTDSPSHAGQHADLNDAVEALEAKVGVDSSAVATSHDYKLANLTVGDITDLTATAEELNIMDGVTTDTSGINTAATLAAGSNTALKVLNTQCQFKVYMSTDQTIGTSSQTVIEFDTEFYDIGSNYDTTAHTFTAPVTGYYHFSCHIQYNYVSGFRCFSTLYVDGVEAARGTDYTGAYPTSVTSTDMYLAADSVVQMRTTQASGVNKDLTSGDKYTYFSGHLISV